MRCVPVWEKDGGVGSSIYTPNHLQRNVFSSVALGVEVMGYEICCRKQFVWPFLPAGVGQPQSKGPAASH